MIIPVQCFTCGKLLGNKYETYLKRNETIQNSKVDEEEKIKMTMDMFKNELKLKRYCCRNVLICTIDMTNIIS